jgi:hypothetical protein
VRAVQVGFSTNVVARAGLTAYPEETAAATARRALGVAVAEARAAVPGVTVALGPVLAARVAVPARMAPTPNRVAAAAAAVVGAPTD